MAILEIIQPDGKKERRELSKQIPLSIGSHSSSDVVIADEAVQPLHCRIAWKKNGYEVTAGSNQGVEVNGKTVSFTTLRDGDVLQIGPIDLKISGLDSSERADDAEVKKATTDERHKSESKKPRQEASASAVDLKPLTEDEIQLAPQDPDENERGVKTDRKQKGKKEARRSQTGMKFYSALDDNDDDDDGGGDGSLIPILDPPSDKPEATLVDVEIDIVDESSGREADEVFISRSSERKGSAESKESASAAAPSPDEQIVTRLKREFAKARPGEQEMLRSPLVLGLGGGSLILLLLGATFFFVIGRDQAQRHYDAAMGHFNSRDYNQAIPLFEDFIAKFRGHRLRNEARWNLSVSRVERHISGSVPDWPASLKGLNELLKEHRNDEDFAERKPAIVQFAQTIAVGAAKSAGTDLERSLLDVSTESLAIVEINSPDDAPPVETQQQVAAEQKKSEAILRRHEALTATLAEMKSLLEKKDTLGALRARQELIDRYSRDEYILGNADLRKAQASALTLEQSLVENDDRARDALPAEIDTRLPPPLYLTQHIRSRTNAQSDNQVVFVQSQDAVFAIDTMTGVPKWVRTIGDYSPFFPRTPQTSIPTLLVYHSVKRELQCLQQQDGAIVWRQPLTGDIRGVPLLHEGQIYISTDGGQLWRVDQESGRLTAHLRFAHELAGGPAVAGDGNTLIVAGEESVVYTLGLRPLECLQVTYMGHKPSTIAAPLLKLGSMVLVAENHASNACRLRMLAMKKPDQPLTIAATESIEAGHVLDEIVARGNLLFVPSTGERITVFTASDEPGQKPLSRVTMFQVEEGQGGPIYVSAGPNGQLWMSSTAFRRLELEGDKIKPDPKQLAVGLSSQPLQMSGDFVYVGRKPHFSTAVYFAQVAREEMTTPWRTIVGSPIVRFSVLEGDSVVFVNQTGDVFKVNRQEFDEGGFKLSPNTTLPLPDNLKSPLRAAALSNGKIVVGIGGEKPHAWLINSAGQVESETDLDGPIDNEPFLWGRGALITSGGKIRLLFRDSGQPTVEEFSSTAEPGEVVRWRGVVPIDDEHLVAIDEKQRMVKLQLRESTPPAHLAEIAAVTLEHPIDVAPVAVAGKLCLADASGQLIAWDSSTFDRLHELKLEQPAENRLWTVADHLYVQVGTQKLLCVQLGDEMSVKWELPLTGWGVAGPPLLRDSGLLITQVDGRVVLVDSETGKIMTEHHLEQRIGPGVMPLADALIAVDGDGSVRRIDGALVPGNTTAAGK